MNTNTNTQTKKTTPKNNQIMTRRDRKTMNAEFINIGETAKALQANRVQGLQDAATHEDQMMGLLKTKRDTNLPKEQREQAVEEFSDNVVHTLREHEERLVEAEFHTGLLALKVLDLDRRINHVNMRVRQIEASNNTKEAVDLSKGGNLEEAQLTTGGETLPLVQNSTATTTPQKRHKGGRKHTDKSRDKSDSKKPPKTQQKGANGADKVK